MKQILAGESGGTVRNVQWTVATMLLRRALTFALFLAIARILDPDALGVFREYTLILMAFTLAAPLGLEYLHITAKGRHGRSFAALNTFSLLLGAVFAVALWFGADILGALADSALLPHVIRWTAPILLVHLLRQSLKFDLRRRMRLRLMATYETVNVIFYAALTLALLLVFRQPWTLFAGFFAGDILETALLLGERWRRYRWRFVPLASWAKSVVLWRKNAVFCLTTWATHLLGLFANQAPVFLLGVLFAPHWLGVYYLAQQMIGMPVTLLTSALQQVFLPTLARMNDQLKAASIQRVIFVASTGLWPLLALYGYALFRLTPLLFGPKWTEALPLLAPLGALMASHLVMNPIASAPVVMRRSDIELTWRVGSVLAIGAALWFGARYGFVTAIHVFAGVQIAMHTVFVVAILRLLRIPVLRQMGLLALRVFPPLLSLAAGWLLRDAHWAAAISAVAGVTAAMYLLANIFTKGQLWREMKTILRIS